MLTIGDKVKLNKTFSDTYKTKDTTKELEVLDIRYLGTLRGVNADEYAYEVVRTDGGRIDGKTSKVYNGNFLETII